ncbi:MAG: sugar nucleotide-binding protein [Lachnospiraceae bacterium]|nr:sugar nucleotide-binding protein [Lachnospiraceae bacterium]
MRILITGANGYLGKRLVKAYQEKYEICAATHENMDFTDEYKIREVFDAFRPEIVIHCGAVSDVATCAIDVAKSLEINVHGTQKLARVCHQCGARMIFCSSDQVYMEPLTQKNQKTFYLPHREDELLKPLPIYGQHKLLAEQSCFNENPDSVILRLTLMYDIPDEAEREKGKGMFAENLKTALENRLPQQVLKNISRGMTDCREVVANMEKAWSLPPGIYNFGSANIGTVYDTVKKVFSLFGKESLISSKEGGKERNLLIDTQKIEKTGIIFRDTALGLYQYIKSVSLQ